MAGQLSLKYAGAAFIFAVCAASSSPALAGFQWVAPNDAATAPPMTAPQELIPAPITIQAPTAPASFAPEVISPVVITGNSESAKMPVAENNGVVLGFAKSVPLAVALRQILPSGYAFSVDQNVDMGTLVSFRGGRPWRETLRDALSPSGLEMREQGQMVEVGYATAAAPVVGDAAPTMSKLTVEPGTKIGAEKYLAPPVEPSVVVPPADSLMIAPDIQLSRSASAPAAVTQPWTAERGDHLRKVLESWSSRANVEFDWMSEYDYPIEASVSFTGGFENAVRSLLTGFEGAHPQPVAELHSNPNLGQMVLVVQTRGNTNSD